MAIDQPTRPASSGAIYVLAMIVLVAVIALAGRNALAGRQLRHQLAVGRSAGDQSAGDAVSAVTPFRHAEKALAETDISH